MATSVPPRFCTDYAKRVAKCQKCKMQLEKGVLRMGKIMPNFFVAAKDPSKPPPDMKQYFHKNCLFEMLFKARPTTKVIDDTEEIEGFEDLNAEDQDEIKKLVDELIEKRSKDGPAEPKKTPAKKKNEEKEAKGEVEATPSRKRKNDETQKSKRPADFNEESDYNSFYKFVKVCTVLKDISTNSEKSAVITSLLQKKGFDGDLMLWLSFLVRDSDNRNYNVTDEQLVKNFAKILDMDEAKIQKYVTKSGDVALSIAHAHEKKVTNEKGKWSLQKVDRYLEKLASLEEEDAVLNHLKFAAKRMRHDEVEVLIRLIRKELDTGADAATILRGVHAKASKVYDSDGLNEVVEKYYNNDFEQQPKSSDSKRKVEEPKTKKSRRQQSESDDEEESENEMSESESEVDQDSETDGEEEISGSDSDEVSEISSDDEEEESSFKENSPKKVARGTRTRPRGDNGNIVKKEECPPDMEACRYGEKCYRKNKDHLEQFWHPSS